MWLSFRRTHLGLVLEGLALVTFKHKIIIDLYLRGSVSCCFAVVACSLVQQVAANISYFFSSWSPVLMTLH